MRDHRNLFLKYTAYVALVSFPDLRPEPGSKVEDAALRIPNINNHFTGKRPDCGAYETEQQIPQYGPSLQREK